MRSLKGIYRYWKIIYLAQNYLILKKKKAEENLGKTILRERQESKKSMILKILSMKTEGLCNEEIVKNFIKKVA
jgi:hypothetical protein